MSYDKEDADNVENDIVEESHVRRIKKDAYFVASSDSPGLIIRQLLPSGRFPQMLLWRCCNSPRRLTKRRHSRQDTTRQGERGSRTASLLDQRLWTNNSSSERRPGWATAVNGDGSSGASSSSINGSNSFGTSSINGSNIFGSFSNLDSNQWSKLLTLLNNPTPTQTDTLFSMKNLWILDSGCSHHMTGRKDFL
ncbi:hypothetical protein M9H77_03473 [Catharanthus roseus]|uniref:Uncharacterized protein n=1 Tax=Catharanthus roseus TaxID=4058 RepID=A0ACC0CBI4_CATRO|nr:hypothetical protein M9H77_03473 [Catharanthus roseus]